MKTHADNTSALLLTSQKTCSTCALESFAETQQVLSARIESDAHVSFAVALVGAVVFAQRFGQGAQVDQEPAQCLRAGDGHTWAQRAVEIEVQGLYRASAGCDEADEDVSGLHMADTCLRIPRTAVVADKAFAKIAEAVRRCEAAAGLADEHGNHARLRLSASMAAHARRIALRGQVEKRTQAVGLDRGESAHLLRGDQ